MVLAGGNCAALGECCRPTAFDRIPPMGGRIGRRGSATSAPWGWNGIPSRPHFATSVSNLQLLAKITYRRYSHRELRSKRNIEEWIMDWEIAAIVLLGGAAMGGLAYLLGEYRSLRDRDWT